MDVEAHVVRNVVVVIVVMEVSDQRIFENYVALLVTNPRHHILVDLGGISIMRIVEDPEKPTDVREVLGMVLVLVVLAMVVVVVNYATFFFKLVENVENDVPVAVD